MATNNTGVVYGSDLILMIETATDSWQQVAHATSHTLDISRDVREVSSKSTGEWMNKDYGKISWTASADALVSFDSNVINLETLLDYQIARTKIKVISVQNDFSIETPLDDTKTDYDPASGAPSDNRFVTGSPYYEGEAVISSVSLTAGDNENATFSISLEGASALTKKTVATIS